MPQPASASSNWAARSLSASALAAPRVAPGPIEAACFEFHPDAQIIVNSDWEIVATNRAARKLLAEARGPRALAERLVGGASELLRELRTQIVATIRSQVPSDDFVLPVTPSLSFTVRAVPLGAAFDRALLIVRRQEALGARSVRERFRFTAAESHVAERLSRGLTVPQIALQLGISIETVRCHLKQAYAKAGVHRQAELVAVMLGR